MSDDLAAYRIDTTDGNRIVVELGNRSRKVTGGAKIVQEVLRILLTTPGTNTNEPFQGTGLTNVLRRVNNRGNIESAKVDIITRITDLTDQIRQNQIGADLEPDETLDRLEVLSVEFTNRWIVRVRIRTLTESLIADFGGVLLPEGAELFGGS